MADSLVLGDFGLAAAGLGALLSFVFGAGPTAVPVNFARRRHLHSQFALPLLLEAALLLLFGPLGARLSVMHGLFVPVTVMLLCLMMGLQNAVITMISKAEIRTTHVTGLVTDIGKLVYWNRLQTDGELRVVADRQRLWVLGTLVLAFFPGGVVGAVGFQRLGHAMTLPLALLLLLLLLLAIVPAADDVKEYFERSDA
jgi:uncharacterized membrane protein YoaK (UPF0700 family)